MNTKDIIHNLNAAAVSFRGIPNELLLAIDEALKERDELRAENDKLNCIMKSQAHLIHESRAYEAESSAYATKLQVENERLNSIYMQGCELLESRIKQCDALRALLSSIQDSAECMPVPGGYAYTIDGAMMGKVDKALAS